MDSPHRSSNFGFQWVVLGLAMLSQTSSSFIVQAPAPLAPLFQSELDLTKAEVGFLASATSIGAWSMVLVNGLLVDRFGIRKVMSLGLIVAGSLLLSMALVNSYSQAVAVMFVAGIARCSVFPSSTKAILEWFSVKSRATAMGVKQMGLPVSGVIAATVLPTLGLMLGWRNAIALPGLVIATIGVIVALTYRDAAGSVRVAQGSTNFREAMSGMLRSRPLMILCFIGFTFLMVQLPVLAYTGLYLHEVVLIEAIPDASARMVAAGGYLAVLQVGGAVGRVGWGAISDRIFKGQRMVVLVIIGALSAATVLALSGIGPSAPAWLISVVALFSGAMVIGWNGVYNAVLTEIVGRKYAATGVGLSMTITEIGTISGPPVFGFAVDITHSYHSAWMLLVCISTAGTLMAIWAAVQEKRGKLSMKEAF